MSPCWCGGQHEIGVQHVRSQYWYDCTCGKVHAMGTNPTCGGGYIREVSPGDFERRIPRPATGTVAHHD